MGSHRSGGRNGYSSSKPGGDDRTRGSAFENYKVPKASPADVLRFLLERHGLRQRDVAAELGGESVVSEVLSGKRKLNTAQIEQLSRRFRVSPAVFFSI